MCACRRANKVLYIKRSLEVVLYQQKLLECSHIFRRLLEKFQLYERQQGQPSVEGEEVEEVLTPDERERVERAKRSITK